MSDANNENEPERKQAGPSAASCGSVADAMAWAVARAADEFVARAELFESSATREAARRGDGWVAIPLYRRRHAMLTAAERDAILAAIEACEDITYGGPADAGAARILKSLLERTK